tara:strand:- start:44 stop:625 length:582 start_codon:yes stop_codon:yes gene_type:complete
MTSKGIARIACAVSLSFCCSAAAQGLERHNRQAIGVEYLVPEDEDNRDIRIATISVAREHYLRWGLWLRGAVGMAFTEGVLIPDEGPQSVALEADGLGLGGAGYLRWRPVTGDLIGPFVEGGLGMLFTTEPFPPGRTVWNFSPKYGLGAELDVSVRFNLVIAYRHVHFSNGKGFGHPRNPSYDGNGIVLAISW